jgi:hypothetical protein
MRVFLYGSENLVVDRTRSVGLLCFLGGVIVRLNDGEGALDGIFARVIDVGVVWEVVVIVAVVVVLTMIVFNSLQGHLLFFDVFERRGMVSSSALSPLKDLAPVSVQWHDGPFSL